MMNDQSSYRPASGILGGLLTLTTGLRIASSQYTQTCFFMNGRVSTSQLIVIDVKKEWTVYLGVSVFYASEKFVCSWGDLW